MLLRVMMARIGAVPPAALGFYLDSVSVGFESVLSLRKMMSAARAGIRVRRSSDNAEQDIGFDGSSLDVTALLAFVGSGSGYVRTIYDQSGKGCHAQQATAAAQPRIVNAGVYDGAIKFNGTSNFMAITGMALGTPYLGIYERLFHPATSTSKIIAEASANYNSSGQAFLHFAGQVSGVNFVSINASNEAGAQRAHQYPLPSAKSNNSFIFDRAKSGVSEMTAYVNGVASTPLATPGTVELTGSFSAYTVYLGSRGGTSLFSDVEIDTLMFTAKKSDFSRIAIENGITKNPDYWRTRLNASTAMFKIGSRYFIVDCWHHRVIYSDSPTREIWAWDTLDELNLVGPHSIATDGTILAVDSSDSGAICYYDASTLAFLGKVNIDSRPHRVVYDATTSAFYAIKSTSKQVVKLTRSGMVLSIAHTTSLFFLGAYTRSFRIIDGAMVFVSDNGAVFLVAYDGTSGGYSLTATYQLPAAMTDCNDVFKASSGKWYATSWDPGLIEFDSLAGMHAGTYTDVYAAWGMKGLPYWFEEFDGALWLGNIVHHNGVVKRQGGVTTVIHDYGDENVSSYDRHYNFPPA